jgi:multidrug resistance efflux pump
VKGLLSRWRQALGVATIVAILVPVPVLAKSPSLAKLLAQAQKQLASVNKDQAKLDAAKAKLSADTASLAQLQQSGTPAQKLKALKKRLANDRQLVRTDTKVLHQAQVALNKTSNQLTKKFGTNFGF